MAERNINQKKYQSMPDDFDIIKVKQYNTADDIIPQGAVIYVAAKATENSEIPFDELATGTLTSDITLIAGDDISIVGYQRNYAGIELITECVFANDLTSVIVNGAGKNMSDVNDAPAGTLIMGAFQKVTIPTTSTDSVLIAYR
ncbi:MAG: hypothetical protein RBT65_09845 [Methanolobus sp.]|nr:hypothetical protein [Methanolobus sp.]